MCYHNFAMGPGAPADKDDPTRGDYLFLAPQIPGLLYTTYYSGPVKKGSKVLKLRTFASYINREVICLLAAILHETINFHHRCLTLGSESGRITVQMDDVEGGFGIEN